MSLMNSGGCCDGDPVPVPLLLHPCLASGFVLQDGRSPLRTASLKGHLDVVKTLIEAGANVNQANKVSCPWHCYDY